MEGRIGLERHGAVAEIVLDRPAKHNALTPAMYEQMAEVSARVDRAPDVHVVILRGAGERAFCAGSDLHAVDAYEDFWAWRNRVDYIAAVRAVRKPVIAAVRGWALGGGFELALACDLRVAARSAVFGAPEVTLGWVGAGGAAQHLTRLVGYGQAMRLLLTGERIDAEEAFRLGIVEYLTETGEELDRARELAHRIAAFSPVATQAVKAAVRGAMRGDPELALQLENELMTICLAKRQLDRRGGAGGGAQEGPAATGGERRGG